MMRIGMVESLIYELVDYDRFVYGTQCGVDVDRYELRDDWLHRTGRDHVELDAAAAEAALKVILGDE
jgi:hypothetical protein